MPCFAALCPTSIVKSSIKTPNEYKYKMVPTAINPQFTSATFELKAGNDALLLLVGECQR